MNMRRQQQRHGESGIAFVEVLVIGVILGSLYGVVVMGVSAVAHEAQRAPCKASAEGIADHCG